MLPYKDTVGKLTIGVGRNLSDRGISKDEALVLLNNDVDLVLEELDLHFPWWKGLSDKRQLVLADMLFNMGVVRLSQFRNMLAALKAGDYARAADEMRRSVWATQVGTRAKTLELMMREG